MPTRKIWNQHLFGTPRAVRASDRIENDLYISICAADQMGKGLIYAYSHDIYIYICNCDIYVYTYMCLLRTPGPKLATVQA